MFIFSFWKTLLAVRACWGLLLRGFIWFDIKKIHHTFFPKHNRASLLIRFIPVHNGSLDTNTILSWHFIQKKLFVRQNFNQETFSLMLLLYVNYLNSITCWLLYGTVWKLQDFSITQILREIKEGESSLKICHLNKLR